VLADRFCNSPSSFSYLAALHVYCVAINVYEYLRASQHCASDVI